MNKLIFIINDLQIKFMMNYELWEHVIESIVHIIVHILM